ncbi:MAG TPA: FAD-dependent oxidoreductase, partial [Accumulibacter sp.]|nr:FAD-dependent oxidoreductase [Accumulibacter sp.]
MENRFAPSGLTTQVTEELRAVVGPDHLCITADDLDRYSRCTIPWQRRCSAVVFPASSEEVAEVVRVAARHRVPLWPSSTGRNWGYGTTLAVEDGAIVMILTRMNRIIEVNEELAYAVIE